MYVVRGRFLSHLDKRAAMKFHWSQSAKELWLERWLYSIKNLDLRPQELSIRLKLPSSAMKTFQNLKQIPKWFVTLMTTLPRLGIPTVSSKRWKPTIRVTTIPLDELNKGLHILSTLVQNRHKRGQSWFMEREAAEEKYL